MNEWSDYQDRKAAVADLAEENGFDDVARVLRLANPRAFAVAHFNVKTGSVRGVAAYSSPTPTMSGDDRPFTVCEGYGDDYSSALRDLVSRLSGPEWTPWLKWLDYKLGSQVEALIEKRRGTIWDEINLENVGGAR